MNEAENFHKLEENIIMMKSQRSGIEKDKIIEGGKKMGTDKIIKQNEKISNSFESQIQIYYKAMLSNYLKCKKDTRNITQQFQKSLMKR